VVFRTRAFWRVCRSCENEALGSRGEKLRRRGAALSIDLGAFSEASVGGLRLESRRIHRAVPTRLVLAVLFQHRSRSDGNRMALAWHAAGGRKRKYLCVGALAVIRWRWRHLVEETMVFCCVRLSKTAKALGGIASRSRSGASVRRPTCRRSAVVRCCLAIGWRKAKVPRQRNRHRQKRSLCCENRRPQAWRCRALSLKRSVEQ